ncbi:MAG: pilus assembly protein [Peptococcaceae bacterium]|nr:pilus assembly protein [Peptococcaceae bacterium]
MTKLITQLKKEHGAVQVVEAAYIFPLVFLVLAFLIYLAFYIMQGILIYSYAQQTAVAASRTVSLPGYKNLYPTGSLSTKIDFAPVSDPTELGRVNALMQVHEPYRYFNPGVITGDSRNFTQDGLKNLINQTSLLSGSSLDCDVTGSNLILTQRVNVSVTKKIATPPFFQASGLNSAMDINISATAVVGDTAEFMRNTDMVFELKDYALDNIHINGESLNEQITKYKEKLNHALDKTKVKE